MLDGLQEKEQALQALKDQVQQKSHEAAILQQKLGAVQETSKVTSTWCLAHEQHAATCFDCMRIMPLH